LEVHTQVPVTVAHDSFEKTFYPDLVVNHMLYELKAVAALVKEHEAQGLHYAMLHDIRRVKLVNFGDTRVQGKLLRNAIPEAGRHQPTMRKSGWQMLTPQCERLITHIKELIIHDWK
jgi:hypothetical protein